MLSHSFSSVFHYFLSKGSQGVTVSTQRTGRDPDAPACVTAVKVTCHECPREKGAESYHCEAKGCVGLLWLPVSAPQAAGPGLCSARTRDPAAPAKAGGRGPESPREGGSTQLHTCQGDQHSFNLQKSEILIQESRIQP